MLLPVGAPLMDGGNVELLFEGAKLLVKALDGACEGAALGTLLGALLVPAC
jgi:hypothetical protein